MKKLLLASVLMALAAPASADSIFGTWKTIPDDNNIYGHIKISACGSKICGVLVQSFNADGSDFPSKNVGKQLLWDMTNEGGGKYGGGVVVPIK